MTSRCVPQAEYRATNRNVVDCSPFRFLIKELYVKQLVHFSKTFLAQEEGVTMVEYGLIAALIAVVCVAAVQIVGTQLNAVFTKIGNCLKNALSNGTC